MIEEELQSCSPEPGASSAVLPIMCHANQPEKSLASERQNTSGKS